jgi:hypothetical protein
MKNKTQELLKLANDNPDSSISSAKRVFPDRKAAQDFFSLLKSRLLKIDEWNKNSNLSSYRLFDENGNPLDDQLLAEGVFNRISLKGSGKYDWVRIVEIYETAEEMVITVSPTYDPTDENIDKSVTSHFFTSDANNNFCALLHESAINFYVIGLNEKQNTAETNNPLEAARNIAAANLGTYLGIQKGEWESFGNNFLNPEDH